MAQTKMILNLIQQWHDANDTQSKLCKAYRKLYRLAGHSKLKRALNNKLAKCAEDKKRLKKLIKLLNV